jgi:hypothetical protein
MGTDEFGNKVFVLARKAWVIALTTAYGSGGYFKQAGPLMAVNCMSRVIGA